MQENYMYLRDTHFPPYYNTQTECLYCEPPPDGMKYYF